MTSISVIIPSYNHPEIIFQCVKSLLRQEIGETFEIVVVDSSNREKQAQLEGLLTLDDRIRLIKLDRQTFPGVARNVGIEQARGEIIALIDADCIAEKGWLKNILANAGNNTVITGVIENGTPKNMLGTCSWLVEFNNFLPFSGAKRLIGTAATCNFSANKEVFQRIGGFSDDRAFEDMLFCEQFKRAGGEIYQIPAIRISHVNKTSLGDILRNQTMLGRFSAKVRKKHGMPPHIVFKFPPLAFALCGFRYLSILARVIRTKHIFSYLLYSPVIIYILFWWSVGFYRGAKEK